MIYRVPSHSPVVTVGPVSFVTGPVAAVNNDRTGTVAVTLEPFTSSASGTVTNPEVTGTVAVTLANFTSSASGTFTAPSVTGTLAVTLGSFTTSTFGAAGLVLYPVSISGRKLLDQNSDPYLAYVMSSWSLADLSDANITTALEGAAGNGFNGVVVWGGGGYSLDATWNPKYERKANSTNWWAGTAWQSSLGSAWAAMDWIAAETMRLGMVLHFSFCGGNGTTGARPDWETASNVQMRQVGIDVATRYASYPHIVWHIMLDDSNTVGSTAGQRINALYDGINDTEGATTRPVRWMEVNRPNSTNDQSWWDPTGATTDFRCSINCIYSYDADSVNDFETGWGQTSGPTGDCEPLYVGNPTLSNDAQEFRERNYAIFLEGGCLINFGHEDWWPFGKTGLFTDGETWDTVQTDTEVVQAGYAWTLIETFCKDTTYAPTSSFVTTGEGTGDTKAAQGASNTAALAYFPDNRTIQVDTTIIAGTSNVRLRWYDPTAGTFSTIAASEAQQTGRSVTLPAARGDGTRDFVLVVDALNDVTGTVAVTLAAFTSSASGTSTPPSFTGTVAVTLEAFVSSASGTSTPPSFTGTVAVTLEPFTSSASGTFTGSGISGTVAVTLDAFTSTASGTSTPPPITGSSAVTLAAATSSASGTYTSPAFTGTVAVTLANVTSSATGVIGQNGTAAPTLDNVTANATGTFVPPPITGTAAITLAAFVAVASGFGSDIRESIIRRWRVHADDRRLTPIHDRIYRPPAR